jgi:hypothetical protein
MFTNVSFNFATTISKFDTFSSYHSTIGISMYQKSILPYFIIPSTFSPQASSPLSHHGRTKKFQHPLLPKFFLFSTERAGPSRRRNSTGLAELECPGKPNLLPVCLLICRVFWFLCQQIWFQPIFHFSSCSVPEVV